MLQRAHVVRIRAQGSAEKQEVIVIFRDCDKKCER